MVGRNDPCPCGSGKKYKKCHGKQQTVSINDLVNEELFQVRQQFFSENRRRYRRSILKQKARSCFLNQRLHAGNIGSNARRRQDKKRILYGILFCVLFNIGKRAACLIGDDRHAAVGLENDSFDILQIAFT